MAAVHLGHTLWAQKKKKKKNVLIIRYPNTDIASNTHALRDIFLCLW
jgi:bisphosphoglycerate-independent phosphoglycerate mutase (AlkP superfamily)